MITRERHSLFRKICRLEPKIQDLYEEIKKVQDDYSEDYFCANEHWYGYRTVLKEMGFKTRMSRLAGWNAEHPHLRTSEVYDVVYETLYDVLPPCRKCWCL